MKTLKKISLSIVIFAASYNCFAQELSIRGGLNISNVSDKSVGDISYDDPRLKPGFHFGPTLSLTIKNPVILETGIFYSSKGLKSKGRDGLEQETTYLEKLNLSYLEVPAAIKVKLFERNLSIYWVGGGYLGYALWGNIYKKADISKNDVFRARINWEKGTDYSMKRLDYGAKMGFEVRGDKSTIGIDYLLGLAKVTDYKSYHNRTFEIYYKYQLWSN